MKSLLPGKAITLWQPLATLFSHQLLRYETRNWVTNYRGLVYIHAAVGGHGLNWKAIPEIIAYCFGEKYRALDYPRGVILAKTELVGCHPIHELPNGDVWIERNGAQEIIRRTDPEFSFGHYNAQNYAWEFKEIELLPTPIPAQGRQKLWDFNPQKSKFSA